MLSEFSLRLEQRALLTYQLWKFKNTLVKFMLKIPSQGGEKYLLHKSISTQASPSLIIKKNIAQEVVMNNDQKNYIPICVVHIIYASLYHRGSCFLFLRKYERIPAPKFYQYFFSFDYLQFWIFYILTTLTLSYKKSKQAKMQKKRAQCITFLIYLSLSILIYSTTKNKISIRIEHFGISLVSNKSHCTYSYVLAWHLHAN